MSEFRIQKAECRKGGRFTSFLNSEFCILHSEAGLGGFGFADGSGGVVDEVVDLIEAAEEHGVSVDDDLVEPGVVERAGERGEAGGLVADALDDHFEALAGVGLFAGNASGSRGFALCHMEESVAGNCGLRSGRQVMVNGWLKSASSSAEVLRNFRFQIADFRFEAVGSHI